LQSIAISACLKRHYANSAALQICVLLAEKLGRLGQISRQLLVVSCWWKGISVLPANSGLLVMTKPCHRDGKANLRRRNGDSYDG
jgi:hypothetical protein